ncbi:DUF3466 family protein [Pseudidiomarina marina]|uniref:DUF3466 domain-containing protein n=1 Tax=Pseudidiomarina marina TaxID=502366 RepID=A0A432YJN9_9GAMM|nr:DUF3466 family protein [Pseudidiomarina marina]PHR66933.1 MAG: hypothetical protein COA51_00570 [Idiomarina sp.]RUO61197.1 hypothetical protein CWI76_02730 [Pseudidiomarina marina]
MKQFKTQILVATIASSIGASAAAQNYTVQPITTPDSVQNTYGVAINDQGLAALHMRIPLAAELDFDLISEALLADAGISTEFDPTTDELTYEQYLALVQRLDDRINGSLSTLRIAVNFAGDYDGQSTSLPALLNSAGNASSSQQNSADHQFLGLNQNNVRVGIASAPYTRFEHTFQPEAEEGGETPDPVTINYAQREFTSRALWYDGTNYQLLEPAEQTALGGESGLFDINENNVAVGFQSVAVTPQAQSRLETCAELESSTSASTTPYTCMWSAWHSYQSGTASNLSNRGSQLATNGSIYDMHATVWQLDAQGAVISETTYAPLMERIEGDDFHWSTYAFAVNNNGIAVGQSWTYYGDEPAVGGRIKMPAIFVDGETRAVTTSEDYFWGAATDINDDDIAIGYVLQNIQGTRRAVPFTYSVADDTFTTLPTLFVGSATYPNAINDQGIIVGSAEIDTQIDSARRRVGYYFDLNNPDQGLINLNEAIGCDSDYFIVSADSVNEQNQILVTATKEREYTDENGEVKSEQVAETLILNPESGEFTGCTSDEDKIVRQGAVTTPWGILSMLLIGGLITLRRKFES